MKMQGYSNSSLWDTSFAVQERPHPLVYVPRSQGWTHGTRIFVDNEASTLSCSARLCVHFTKHLGIFSKDSLIIPREHLGVNSWRKFLAGNCGVRLGGRVL